MSSVQISIIVPVYNKEEYIDECIWSIRRQTFRNIEIICVDDGSTDGSAKIIKRHEMEDPRVRYIYKENEGQTKAQRDGVALAKGKLIGFVDADDWIESEMYEKLMSELKKNGTDYITSQITIDGVYSCGTFKTGSYFDMESILPDLVCGANADWGFLSHSCLGLFKKDILISTIGDIDGRIHFWQDNCIVYSYLLKCASITVISDSFYNCRPLENSDSHSADPLFLFRLNLAYQFLRNEFERCQYNKIKNLLIEKLGFLFSKYVLFGLRFRMNISSFDVEQMKIDWPMVGKKRLIVWGCGQRGKRFIDSLIKSDMHELVGVIDINKRGESYNDIAICGEELLSAVPFDAVVITIADVATKLSIKSRLLILGVAEDKIIV